MVLALSLLLASLSSSGCVDAGQGEGRGVLVIAVDGLRADHLSSAGYDRATTPNLDRLAEEGVRFEQLLSSAPLPVPAHASLLSGSDPNLARRRVPQWMAAKVDQAWSLPEQAPRLAVELGIEGFSTAAFYDHADLAPVVGLDRGFQKYEPVWDPREADDSPGAERATRFVRQWLLGLSPRDDWFAYVHLSDLDRLWTQVEYLRDTYFPAREELDWIPPVGTSDPALFAIPPSRWIGGSFELGVYEARYDGALRRLDERLGLLFDALKRSGRYEDTTICVVGTCGLQFGESGLILDHGRLSYVDLHVPWILKPAAGFEFEAGRAVDSLASLIDVAPTLLELSGVAQPREMLGVSHADSLAGTIETPRERAFASCGIQGGYAAFDEEWALEVTVPHEAEPGVVIGWFGELPDQPTPPFELAYRYRDEAYPGLDVSNRAALTGTPRLTELAVAARDWIERNEALRDGFDGLDGFLFEVAEEPAR